MFNFEVFHKHGKGPTKGSYVSISPRGAVRLSKELYNLLGRPRSAEFLYDVNARVIGIRFLPADTPTSYAYTVHEEGNAGNLNAAALCKKYNIFPSSVERYQAELHNGILCIYLDRPLVNHPS